MYKNDNSAFLLLALSLFVIFDIDKPLISCLLCKSKNLWNIFMIHGRNVEQDQKNNNSLPSLLLALSPFVMSDSDYPLILCLFCKSETLWDIFMMVEM